MTITCNHLESNCRQLKAYYIGLGLTTSALGITAIVSARVGLDHDDPPSSTSAWVSTLGGGALVLSGLTCSILSYFCYSSKKRITPRALERGPTSSSNLLETIPEQIEDDVHLPPFHQKIDYLKATSIKPDPFNDYNMPGFKYLPMGFFLGKLPTSDEDNERFFAHQIPKGCFTLFTCDNDFLKLPPYNSHIEYDYLQNNCIYQIFMRRGNTEQAIVKNIKVVVSMSDIPSLLTALNQLHICLSNNRQPIIGYGNDTVQTSTFLALFFIHINYIAGHSITTQQSVELIKQYFPTANPSLEVLGKFQDFLVSISPQIERWYRSGLIFQSSCPYLQKSTGELTAEFMNVVWKSQHISHPRQYDQTWSKYSRVALTSPYEENEFKLSSGIPISASKLPYGFITTQMPLFTEKIDTRVQFQHLVSESGARVIIAIALPKERIPATPNTQLFTIDELDDFQKIEETIVSVEQHRQNRPIVVMCNDGSSKSCTYIACHLAKLILSDITQDGYHWQLSLEKLHELLRLDPVGRPGAIYFEENYLLIDNFICELVNRV